MKAARLIVAYAAVAALVTLLATACTAPATTVSPTLQQPALTIDTAAGINQPRMQSSAAELIAAGGVVALLLVLVTYAITKRRSTS